ncbi:MAG: glucose-6-phosphate dehydrogenase assembly protein OpcA [Pyrinomonadaceae bacterium]
MSTQESTNHLSVERGVDASKVEKELTAMWAEMSASEGEGQHAGVVRACVLNLIVYAASGEERAEADDLLETVVERHPCRAILIAAERESKEARLDAYASTRCQISTRGSKRICGEQITIEAEGAAVENVSTAVAPLLVPDVPVFLWWKDIPHEEDKLFDRLSAMADRVVIDSASFDRPHEDLLRLAEVLSGGHMHLSDLNWGRLTSWRSLVASFWDVSDYRDSLAHVERIQIEYDPPDRAHESVAPKALLALGWIVSCLGWDVTEDGHTLEGSGARFSLRDKEGREVEALLSATDDIAGRDGWITSLTISTHAGDEFYVVLHMNARKLETGVRRREGSADVGRVLAYEARTEGQRLSAELEILSRDMVYETSVALAARMLVAATA